MSCNHPIHRNLNGVAFSVPCGKCISCIKSCRNSWLIRLSEEYKASVTSFFITLTYDDLSVPLTSTGLKVLRPVDTQLFLKRFRKQLSKHGYTFRYFLVGEYGSTTRRPHYHLLAFFAEPISFQTVHQFLLKAWTKGFITVSEVTPGRIGYCCKYVNMVDNLPPVYKPYKPFRRMSLGIGRSYLSDNIKEYHRSGLDFSHDSIQNNLYVAENGYKYALPRYYKDRIFTFSERAFIKYKYEAKAATSFDEYIREQEKISKILNHESENCQSSNSHLSYIKDCLSSIRSEEEKRRLYLNQIIKTQKL